MLALLLPVLAIAAGDPLHTDYGFECPAGGCGGVLPVRPETSAALLTNGEASFAARVQTLEAAKRSIRIQALIFTADESGLYIAKILERKKKEGLDIRVIVDATSNLSWQTQWMYFDLKQHGIEVEGYEALYLAALGEEVKLDDPLRANKRYHDKMWIIDGEDPNGVAIVGGMNIANEYFRVDTTPLERWRDQDMYLRGAIVADVVRCFDRNYDYLKTIKSKLPGPINPDNAWKLTRATLDKLAKIEVPFWTKPELIAAVERAAKTPFEPALRPVLARFVQSRPREGETYIQQTYVEMIRRAQRSILIANAYFIPSRALAAELLDAVRRGVKVTILTNSPATNDIAQIAVLSRHLYAPLLAVNEEGVTRKSGGRLHLHEWVGKRFNEGTLHSKFAVFDDASAIVGSYNLDPRSERWNSETVLVFRDAALAGELARVFLEHDLPRSAPVTPSEARRWRNPPGLKKKFDLLFALPIREYL